MGSTLPKERHVTPLLSGMMYCSGWMAPDRVFLHEKQIVWNTGTVRLVATTEEQQLACFNEMLRLKVADDSEVEAFAKKWGVLGHKPVVVEGDPKKPEAVVLSEPCDVYKEYASAIEAVIECALLLEKVYKLDKNGKYDDIKCKDIPIKIGEQIVEFQSGLSFLFAPKFEPFRTLQTYWQKITSAWEVYASPIEGQQYHLSAILTDCLRTESIYPAVCWENEQWTIKMNVWHSPFDEQQWDKEWMDRGRPPTSLGFGGEELRPRPSIMRSLFTVMTIGAIAYKLNWAYCVECGKGFAVTRSPRNDQACLCKPCSRKRVNERNRQNRERKKAVKMALHTSTEDPSS